MKLSRNEAVSRRKALLLAAGGGASLTAGCLGGDADDQSSGGSDDQGGSGSNGQSSSDSSAGNEWPEYDPEDLELPQPADRLVEDNLYVGTGADLEQWRNSEVAEPANGNDPRPLPDDEDEWLDPDTLQFSLGRGEESEDVYVDQLGPLMANIEAETGVDVEYQLVDDRAAAVEAFRAGRLHVGNMGGGAIPLGVNVGGLVPFAFPVEPHDDGSMQAGYCWWIIARRDNDDVRRPEDLNGIEVAHGSENSFSGNIAPSALMENLFGITPGEDYEYQLTGSHDASIRSVELGDFDAAQCAATSFERMARADEIDPSEFRVVHRDVFPSGPQVYHHALHPDLKAGIERAHFDYEYDDDITQNAIDGSEFVQMEPDDYRKFYDIILRVESQLGETYEA